MSSSNVVEVQLKGVMPTSNGCALFLGCPEKTFIIYVDPQIGTAISALIKGIERERPMTHDFLGNVLEAFEADLQRVVINKVINRTFYARSILKMENELGTKICEIDCRPSDGIALAIRQKAPLYVYREVLDSEEDMSELLERILREQEEE